jgi:hypothetical protein
MSEAGITASPRRDRRVSSLINRPSACFVPETAEKIGEI